MESTLCEAALNPLHWLQVMINHYAELPDWKLTSTRPTHWTYDLLWQESCVQSRAEINFLPALSAAYPSGALRNGHPGPGGGSSSGRTHSRVGTHRCREARKLPTKILQRLTAGRKKEREREGKVKEKKKKKDETDSQLIVPWIPAVISRVFPTYPLYTTSKRFALWNHLCDIWANRRTAREVFKRATNRKAGKQRVGVSPGVHHETAAGRSWDEDAGGCGASSVQLGCSDSCPVRVLFTLFSSSSFLFFFFLHK